MNLLLGCEVSGTIRDAMNEKGHNCWSCDLKEAEGQHIQGDLLLHLGPNKYNHFKGWDGMIVHPPCTFLAGSGNQWMYHPEDRHLAKHLRRPNPFYPNRMKDAQEAADFVLKCWNAPIRMIALENPRGRISNFLRIPDQIVQPHFFGDSYQKTTCLWLKNLPRLKKTNVVDPGEFIITKGGKKIPKWYSDAKVGNKDLTQTVRSQTFPGMAKAMADQWFI